MFDEYSDDEIYEALRRVHLLSKDDQQANGGNVHAIAQEEGRNENMFKNLDNVVSEGGENYSQGEKQLICMARAILKRNKVLVMDEATASIDYETDELSKCLPSLDLTGTDVTVHQSARRSERSLRKARF